MKKVLMTVAALAVALPFAASAATIPALAIFSGQTQVWGNPGQTVTVTPHVWATSGEVVHALRTDVIGDSQESVCHDVANFTGAQDIDVPVSVTLPPNTGDYGFTVQVYTAANLQQANAMTGSAACQGTNTTAYNQGNVIHVIPSGSGSGNTPPSGGSTDIAQLLKLIAELQKQIADLKNPTTPAPSAKCVAIAEKMTGSMYGTRNNANAVLQGYLIGEGMSIPALAAGASFGFYGPQTQAAVTQFKAVNQCS